MNLEKREIARGLRKKSTHSEHKLWLKLRNMEFLGHKFRRQFVVRSFVVDFYCPQLKLAIEVDGEIHKYQKDRDKLRQKVIEQDGIIFLRFKSKDVIDNLRLVLGQIKSWKANQPNPPSPITMGEGSGVRV